MLKPWSHYAHDHQEHLDWSAQHKDTTSLDYYYRTHQVDICYELTQILESPGPLTSFKEAEVQKLLSMKTREYLESIGCNCLSLFMEVRKTHDHYQRLYHAKKSQSLDIGRHV